MLTDYQMCMHTTVMVGEKPKVASRLAEALGDHSVEENRGVKNYVLEKGDREIIIAPAVGHIFNLEDQSDDWDYPTFDVDWVPTFETDDSAGYMKKYYRNLRDQLEKADEYINACDFDLEGSVIGSNVIKQLSDASENEIKRMKFSTLTSSDLQEAFHELEGFDRGMTEAGLTRHVLDFYYGVNVSRALMKAVRENDRYKTLSTGRVQGPALKILAEKEKEIQKFEPDPYWEIYLELPGFEAQWEDEEDRIWDEERAENVFSEIEPWNHASVIDVSTRDYKHRVPVPFNLTDLQSEASSQFRISPKRTQSIAQSLYESGLISYPRTESQKLPAKIGYKNILNKLKGIGFSEKASKVLEKDEVYPKQGGKEDDAHPAIYPTGKKPSGLSDQEEKIYDLVVKRFLAVFGEAAERRSYTLTLEIEGHEFKAKAKTTVKRNWFDLYEPYVNVEDADIPEVGEGEQVEVEDHRLEEKETKPPRRYSQSRIVSELEDRNLGTKATRASIIDRLYDRDYIENSPIEVTDLGLTIAEVLDEHTPELVSEELTREFEEEMEAIREGDNTRQRVLQDAEQSLEEALNDFRDKQEEVGEELVETIDAERERKRKLGPCQVCEEEGREGGTLQIIKTGGSRFVGCTNYPDCENTYPLPNNGDISSTDKTCDECGKPVIYVERSNGRNYSMCIDPDCPSKDDW